MRESSDAANAAPGNPNPGLRTGQEQAGAGKNGNVPPEARRFKPGRSGNPGGRPRQILTPLLRELLVAQDQKFAEFLVRAWFESACQGKGGALKELLDRVDGPSSGAGE